MALYGAIVGFMYAGRLNYIKKRLKAVGAVSEENTVIPEIAKLKSQSDLKMLAHLVKRGNVGKTEEGKYWWKEDSQKD